MPRLKQAHFLWGGGIYFPSSLTLRYRWQGPSSRQVFAIHLPTQAGPGFVSCPVFQGRGSVSPSSAETVQVKAGFCVWTTHLFSLCFETCKISYVAAKSVMHLKLIFVFHPAFSFPAGKLTWDPNLPHSLNWKLLWWFQPIPFLISVVTSQCFSPWIRLLLHQGYVLSLCKQVFPKSITYYFLKLLYLLIANVGASCSSLNG